VIWFWYESARVVFLFAIATQ